jgi:hypothetical protein
LTTADAACHKQSQTDVRQRRLAISALQKFNTPTQLCARGAVLLSSKAGTLCAGCKNHASPILPDKTLFRNTTVYNAKQLLRFMKSNQQIMNANEITVIAVHLRVLACSVVLQCSQLVYYCMCTHSNPAPPAHKSNKAGHACTPYTNMTGTTVLYNQLLLSCQW